MCVLHYSVSLCRHFVQVVVNVCELYGGEGDYPKGARF